MPSRVDLRNVQPDHCSAALDRLIELGALDVERLAERAVAALMPDSIAPEQVADALGVSEISVSPAVGRDADSVWVLSPRPVQIGRLRIVPADVDSEPGALKMIDTPAFGTGRHATTALCLEALDETIQAVVPEDVLDVGTGSGVLVLAALMLGVPRGTGIDTDTGALSVARRNAAGNRLSERLQLVHGGPDAVTGTWPLVVANIVAATLTEIAPALVRRVGHHGRLVLSGIPHGVEPDVERAYRDLGMRSIDVKSRAGWTALVMHASW
jgi:ribosomal protein L11 methyltransferase